MDDSPVLGIGTANAGPYGFRNPYNSLVILPGVSSYSVTAEIFT